MRKLCIFSFSFALAVLLCQYVMPLKFMPLSAAVSLAMGLLGYAVIKGNRRLAAIIAGAGLAVGFLWNYGYDTLVFSRARQLDGAVTSFEATVSDFPVEMYYGSYVDIKIDSDGPDLKARAYVFDDTADALRPGDRVRMTAELTTADRVGEREITGYTSKGYFLFAHGAENVEVISSPGMGISNFHRYLAKAIKDKISETFPLGTDAFMTALLTGDRKGIDQDAWAVTAMQRAGVSHIIAVSGMHVSILAGFFLTVFGRRRWAVMSVIPILFLFMAVSGFSASVVRAVIMQVFVLTAPLVMRESDGLTSLSAALLVLLLINPYAIAGVGLQLSFAATLGIILFTPRIQGFLTKGISRGREMRKRLLRSAAGGVSATLGALALTTPISAYYFRCVSLIAPVTNLLVLWAVSIAFILGALAVGAAFIWLPAGRVIAFCPAVAVKFIMFTVKALAKPQLAAVYLDGAAVTVWFGAAYIAVMALVIFKAGARWYACAASVGITALCAIFIAKDMLAAARPGYTMAVMDVGQGQGIVITSGEYTAVIDCGSMSGQDAGEIVERRVRALGRDRVDVLVLTHYHADHANGAERLIKSLDVEVMAAPEPKFAESDLDELVLEAADAEGTQVLFVTDETEISLGETVITLYPPMGMDTENERGIMAVVSDGQFETLITGDTPGYIERQLVGRYELPDIECLVVGHHGSASSTTETLLDAVTPEAAVISVGENSYGHPTEEVLERLSLRGIEILRTDLNGDIEIRSR